MSNLVVSDPEVVRGLVSIGKVNSALSSSLIEREVEVGLALTALVARQHLFLLGPPGTAKSLLAETVCKAVDSSSGAFFQILLTKFTSPDEVFGPPSIKALMEEERYLRNTKSYLPSARVAFLDEIWKASSAIVNALLTILNERAFDNDGKRVKVPLEASICASNEMPTDGLEAIYDRFLLRREVSPISNSIRLLDVPAEIQVPKIVNLDQVQKAASQVVIPDSIKGVMSELRERLRSEGISISDRRFQRSSSIVRATAILDEGRLEADVNHLKVLAHSWWNSPDQYLTVNRVVSDAISLHTAGGSGSDLTRDVDLLTGFVSRLRTVPQSEIRNSKDLQKRIAEFIELGASIVESASKSDADRQSAIEVPKMMGVLNGVKTKLIKEQNWKLPL